MNAITRQHALTWALRFVGLVFLVGVYPLTVLWPSGWTWHAGQSEYLQMILALYATLGVFLLLASAHPAQHVSLIAFTIWSSIVHGLVMAAQAMSAAQHAGHLLGGVPALLVVAAVLGWLCPSALVFRAAGQAALQDVPLHRPG